CRGRRTRRRSRSRRARTPRAAPASTPRSFAAPAERARDLPGVGEERIEGGPHRLAAEARRRPLHADDRRKLAARAEDGRRDGVQVRLALADGLRVPLPPDTVELRAELPAVGDRA